MSTIVLPGLSPKTEDWISQLAVDLALPSPRTQSYACWPDSLPMFDKNQEAERIEHLQASFVLAKSMGTLVATHAFQTAMPMSIIFIGVPLKFYDQQDVKMLNRLSVRHRLLIVQNHADPVASSAQVTSVLTQSNCVHELQGNDHDYFDTPALKQAILPWLEGNT